MNIYRNLAELPAFRNAVLTIGSFDGVHQGHQKILTRINSLARETGGESVVVTFHPHPRQIVYPKDDTLRLITTIEEKLQLFERFQVDTVVVVPFTVEFSQLTADEYIERFLIEKFHPRYIVIGYDHKFGTNRIGDINFLRWYAKDRGYEVVEIERQTIDDISISSSKIRAFLENGNPRDAAKLLNHYFTLTGEVVEGQKIGGKIGFPTANIRISDKDKLIPPNGIYAVFVVHQQRRYQGMLYIGTRPTLKTQIPAQTIEVNIFDFDKTIYGHQVQVELVEFIRNDEKFEDLAALHEQLKKDKIRAFNILERAAQETTIGTTIALPSVGIVILNYNGRDFLKKFLPFVLGTTYQNTKLWVADNGSTDDSCEFLQTYYPNISTIQIENNLGFADGYNHALAQIEGEVDYYVLLNSDVEVSPGWLDPLVQMLEEDKTIAAGQPKILQYQDRQMFEYAGAAGGWIDLLGYPFCRGRVLATTEKDEGQYDKPVEIYWATGAAMLIRSRLFHRIGGFDSDYFAHMEEIDLCCRLKKAGFKIAVNPTSVVYHVGGGTLNYNTPKKAFLNFRNSLFSIFKNENKWRLLWMIPLRLILDGLAALLFLSEKKYDHIGAILRAHYQFYRAIPRLLKKRKTNARLIVQNRISKKGNRVGIFQGSIILEYYLKGNRTFRKITGR